MTAKEIGSEFWITERGAINKQPKVNTYLSGRAALLAVIIDMKRAGIRTVALPDYCCESMIEPFLRQDMKIHFYPIVKNGQGLVSSLEASDNFDAVMLVNFFGFMTEDIQVSVQRYKEAGKTVLLDQTHSMFTGMPDCAADYIFGSFRKWTAVEAGFASTAHGTGLITWDYNETGAAYLSLRDQARRIKARFVADGYCDESRRKQQLRLFNEAEEFLDRKYCSDTNEENKCLLADLDVWYISSKRKKNARVIYKLFPQLRICKPLFIELPVDCIPLAIPVLVPDSLRDSLRSFLRDNGVFCPVHWPLSDLHNPGPAALEIYRSEISLVCDQRYCEEDMAHMMELIKIWETRSFV